MVKKVSIIGCGAVGSGVAYNLLSRLDLKELTLVDNAGDMASGVALDLEDTRGFLNFSTKITGAKNIASIKDSDIIVITAGVARKEGMTRLDLLKINSKVVGEICQKIKKFAPLSIVITVTNPLDIITYVAIKETGFPSSRVIGMGVSLDTSRLLNILHKKTGVSTESMEGYVFGMHSKDMLVSQDRLKIKGESLSKFISEDKIKEIVERIPMRGAEIVGFLKNRSAHFAPALSCACLVEAIAKNQNKVIPVSVKLNGEYGLKGVCIGVPCIVNRKGVEKIIEIELSDSEKEQLSKVKSIFKECMI